MADLKFYKAYQTIAPASPAQSYRDSEKALIDSQFENASSFYTISEELKFGTLTFIDVGVRITDVIADKTTGEKLDSDFRRLIFKPNHTKGLGYRYKINSKIWLTVNSDDWSDTSVVRKCNHTLKWYDAQNNLIEEPCIVEFNQNSTNLVSQNKIMPLPDKKCNIILQNNDYTNTLSYNQKFIFNKASWQIVSFDFITKPNLVILNLEQYQTNTATDDLTNEIANAETPSTPEGTLW